jgi:hypothetical protein
VGVTGFIVWYTGLLKTGFWILEGLVFLMKSKIKWIKKINLD